MKSKILSTLFNILMISLLLFVLYINISYYLFGRITLAVVRGNSMLPLLQTNDVVVLTPPVDIGLGDVIVFRNDRNEYVIHRVIAILTCSDGSKLYITKGDNNFLNDIVSGIISVHSTSCSVVERRVLHGYEDYVGELSRGISINRIVGKVVGIDKAIFKITGFPILFR